MDDNSTPDQPNDTTSTKRINPPARIRRVASEPAPSAPQPRRQRRAAFKKADLARAISAAAKAGLVTSSFEVTRDGTIRIFTAGAEQPASLFDQWADKL
jgi:hypothetical protein